MVKIQQLRPFCTPGNIFVCKVGFLKIQLISGTKTWLQAWAEASLEILYCRICKVMLE